MHVYDRIKCASFRAHTQTHTQTRSLLLGQQVAHSILHTHDTIDCYDPKPKQIIKFNLKTTRNHYLIRHDNHVRVGKKLHFVTKFLIYSYKKILA
jgi:hypothetical protein